MLSVKDGQTEAFYGIVLVTKPDEIVFAHRFKDVLVRENELIVRDLFGQTLFALDLTSMAPTSGAV